MASGWRTTIPQQPLWRLSSCHHEQLRGLVITSSVLASVECGGPNSLMERKRRRRRRAVLCCCTTPPLRCLIASTLRLGLGRKTDLPELKNQMLGCFGATVFFGFLRYLTELDWVGAHRTRFGRFGIFFG